MDYRFEIIEGKRICVNNGIYLLRFENSEATIKTINGWNLTLNESLWVSNVLKCLNGTIYAASVGIAKIEDGKKDFVTKRVSYEGTRDLEGKFVNVMVERIHRGLQSPEKRGLKHTTILTLNIGNKDSDSLMKFCMLGFVGSMNLARLASRMKITFLLLLSVLTVLITLGCLQKPSDNSIKEISPEMLGMRIHTDREVYVKEPITIFVENIGNKTIKIKPKIPWEICSDEGCLEVKQSSVAFGIKKNGYESGEWIVIEPGGIALWTYPLSLTPGEYLVKLSKDAVVIADGKGYSVKALCKFKVLEKEPGLKLGRLYLLERKSKFGNINLRGSEISVEGLVDEEGKGLSLLFSIEPPLNGSMNLLIRSDLGFVRIMLYSASSSWYTIEISNFVNKTQRTVDVRKKFFKETLNVSVAISKECVTVENIDTGEEMKLYPSEDRLKEVYGDSLEISRTMQPPTYIVYGDTMTVSLEFGKREGIAEYLLITTGFSPDIPKKPKLWIRVSDSFKSSLRVKVGPIKPARVKCDISEEEVLKAGNLAQ